jgi:hypothetical protein
MAVRIARGELPGMVTLRARGEEVYVDAMGVVAFGSNESMRRDAIFRITSMTKANPGSVNGDARRRWPART